MGTAFRLQIELLTPVAINGHLTLDGLLSAAIFNATGRKGAETLEHIPLDLEQGIFKGSSLFFGRNFRHQPVHRVMSLKGIRDLSVNAFKPNGRGGKYIAVDQQRGPFKAAMDNYPGVISDRVWFWGVGDGDACRRLIEDFIPGIGKRANGGAGGIGAVAHQGLPDGQDHSWVMPDGMPARPLPVDLWRQIGGRADAPVADLAVSVPYWQTPKIEAVFPVSKVAPFRWAA